MWEQVTVNTDTAAQERLYAIRASLHQAGNTNRAIFQHYQRLTIFRHGLAPAVFDSPVTGGGGEGCNSEKQGKKSSGIHDCPLK